MSKGRLHLLRPSLLSSYTFATFLLLSVPSSLSFAHNDSIMVIPVARVSVNLDGQLSNEEWSDAYQQNLTSAGVPGEFTLLYLKYDFTKKVLQAGFDVPDATPSSIKEKLDQISFQFDTQHDATDSINADDHVVVIGRDEGAEYYIGDPERPGQLKSVRNSSLDAHTMELDGPFSRIDFAVVNSSNSRWTAEIEVYFKNEFTQPYGFSMQQVDFHPSPNESTAPPRVPLNASLVPATGGGGFPDSNHANFPMLNRTIAYIPSTWGDIRLADLQQILENIRNLCPSTTLPISSDILCISGLNRNQMVENEPTYITVSGNFANYINNTGIKDERIHINIVDSSDIQRLIWDGGIESDDITNSDGKFEHQLNGVTLPRGNYLVKIEPQSLQYRGLNATAQLVVTERAFTIDDAAGYIQLLVGIVGGIVALAVGFPSLYKHTTERKRKSIFNEQIKQINNIYYSNNSATHREQLLMKLKQKRIEIIELLDNGKIDEDQYKVLDGKISEYEQRAGSGVIS